MVFLNPAYGAPALAATEDGPMGGYGVAGAVMFLPSPDDNVDLAQKQTAGGSSPAGCASGQRREETAASKGSLATGRPAQAQGCRRAPAPPQLRS